MGFSVVNCPHCHVAFNENRYTELLGGSDDMKASQDADGYWHVWNVLCPNCQHFVIGLRCKKANTTRNVDVVDRIVHPPGGTNRPPLPVEVPEKFAVDYREAALVLPFSPKASAALSRRCLQDVLSDTGLSTKKELAQQLDEAIPKLPEYVVQQLDLVRNLGNFAAHPQKSKTTGEIVDVEPGEADACLDALDDLFDHCLVKPERAKTRRAAMNAKLSDAGKPPMK